GTECLVGAPEQAQEHVDERIALAVGIRLIREMTPEKVAAGHFLEEAGVFFAQVQHGAGLAVPRSLVGLLTTGRADLIEHLATLVVSDPQLVQTVQRARAGKRRGTLPQTGRVR